MQAVQDRIPYEAGVYEWGARPPKAYHRRRVPEGVVAFYVGEAAALPLRFQQCASVTFL